MRVSPREKQAKFLKSKLGLLCFCRKKRKGICQDVSRNSTASEAAETWRDRRNIWERLRCGNAKSPGRNWCLPKRHRRAEWKGFRGNFESRTEVQSAKETAFWEAQWAHQENSKLLGDGSILSMVVLCHETLWSDFCCGVASLLNSAIIAHSHTALFLSLFRVFLKLVNVLWIELSTKFCDTLSRQMLQATPIVWKITLTLQIYDQFRTLVATKMTMVEVFRNSQVFWWRQMLSERIWQKSWLPWGDSLQTTFRTHKANHYQKVQFPFLWLPVFFAIITQMWISVSFVSRCDERNGHYCQLLKGGPQTQLGLLDGFGNNDLLRRAPSW